MYSEKGYKLLFTQDNWGDISDFVITEDRMVLFRGTSIAEVYVLSLYDTKPRYLFNLPYLEDYVFMLSTKNDFVIKRAVRTVLTVFVRNTVTSDFHFLVYNLAASSVHNTLLRDLNLSTAPFDVQEILTVYKETVDFRMHILMPDKDLIYWMSLTI